MPYKAKDELPDSVKGLPDHAQDVYMSAYNSAHKQYGGDEERCAQVAWAAVKRAGYKKGEDGKWVKTQEAVVEQEMVRLSLFGAGIEPTVTALTEDAATVTASGQNFRVGYVKKGEAYAFGKPEVVAESAPEPFTAKESERIELTVAEDDAHKADPAEGNYPVIIIQEGENRTKHRRYTKKAVCEADTGKYVGLPMHLDHAGKEGDTPVRSVRDVAGIVKSAWHAVSEDGKAQLRGVVHVFDDWLRARLHDADFRKIVGLSHVADVAGRTENIAGKVGRCIEAITQPYAVDWVSKAAFGGRVAESEQDPINRRVEDLTMLETLTAADLKRDRPDIVTELRDEFRVAEADTDEARKTADRIAEMEKQVAAARAEAQRVKLNAALVAEATKAEYKIPDEVRPAVVERVAARLSSATIDDAKLSETVAEGVKAEVAFGQRFAAAPRVEVPAGKAEAKPEPTAREKLQDMSDKMFGL